MSRKLDISTPGDIVSDLLNQVLDMDKIRGSQPSYMKVYSEQDDANSEDPDIEYPLQDIRDDLALEFDDVDDVEDIQISDGDDIDDIDDIEDEDLEESISYKSLDKYIFKLLNPNATLPGEQPE